LKFLLQVVQADCSHNRAHALYSESISSANCSFIGYKCTSFEDYLNGKCLTCNQNSCSQIGYHAKMSKSTGKMFIITRDVSPFCGNQYYFSINITVDSNKTAGEILFINGNESISITKYLINYIYKFN
jgi:hypothetical protein